jgi:glucosylceramidase
MQPITLRKTLFIMGLTAVAISCSDQMLTDQDAAMVSQPNSEITTASLVTTPDVVNQYVTHGDKSALFQEQASKPTFATGSNNNPTVELIPETTYQSIDGFGYTVTQASAYVMMTQLNTTQRSALLTELFDPSNGIGISFIRIGIGATDLSTGVYTYDDVASGTDVTMSQFSLNGPDLTYLIPVLKEILAVAPSVKIIATPWSAPKWMKSNNSFVGGNLSTAYYDAYATYFVKYLQAMSAQGINIYAITPQNEPENPNNNPSMTMTSTEQTNFILKLAPAITNAGFSTKIIVFDHNCDNTSYPTSVLTGAAASYTDGAAFHLYAGSISAMSTVHNATGKNVYFTEQFTSSTGNFSGDLGWHMQNVMIGGLNNWAKTALEWNLATNSTFGPYTSGGCTTCLGALTINSGGYTRNVSYYIVAHMSKFIRPGALRVSSTSSSTNLVAAGFVNNSTNGSSKVLVVYNKRPTNQTFNIKYAGKIVTVTLKKNSVGTYVWY